MPHVDKDEAATEIKRGDIRSSTSETRSPESRDRVQLDAFVIAGIP
jgi:hypothetical protein